MASRSVSPGDVIILAEDANNIREVLEFGLSLYGEFIERRNAWEINELCGRIAPDNLRPINPSAGADTVSRFAQALTALTLAQFAAQEVTA